MKLDFLSLGGGGGPAGSGATAPAFDLRPPPRRQLDDARPVILIGLVVAGAFFGLLLLFAGLAPISGAATVQGEVTTSGTAIVVQPQTGGVVTELLVREGQHVRAGQPLVRMNGVRSGAAAEQAQAKRDGLRALQARLIAERDSAEAIAYPADLTRRVSDPVVAGTMASQDAIFRRHREILFADREMASTDTVSASAQQRGTERQLALIQDELAGMRALYAKGYARKTQVRALERAAAELEAGVTTAQGTAAKSRLQRARLSSDQMMQTVAQLSNVDAQLAQVDPALRVTQYDARRDILRAPVSGRVSGLSRLGPGTVLGTGRTVMELVPDGRALIVEAQIRPTDIDDVRVGSPADLRFTSINPRGASSFDGTVVALSPAPVEGQSGRRFRAQIKVNDPTELVKNSVRIKPGIPVTVHITTHERTLLDYLLSPIGDVASGAFREE